MLKNKFILIALIAILILSLTIPVVRAENETDVELTTNSEVDSEDVIAPDDDHDHTQENQTIANNNIKKADVYLTGDEVTIDYVVDGNLFVVAKTVNINSQIGGDAFICASKINIGEQGYIFSNLFAAAQDVEISGVVYDLYACAQTTTINGYVYRDVKVLSNTLNISGTIGRNAYVSVENMNFPTEVTDTDDELVSRSNSMIYGDLNYSSKSEINIPDESVIGSVNYNKIDTPEEESVSGVIQDYIWDCGTFIVTVAVIWLLILWLAPKFLTKADEIVASKALPSLGFGVLASLIMIFATIVLLILGITAEVALLGLGAFILLLFIGVPIFTISINQLICKKLKIEKNIATFGVLIITSAVIWLISLIPIVGGLVNFVIKFIGLGIIIKYIFSNKKDSTNVEEKPKKVEKAKKSEKESK